MTFNARIQAPEFTGRQAFAVFAGLFAIVAVVNAVFVFSALSTNTGVVANESYRKGLNYGERIAADERQRLLGWQNRTTLSSDGSTLTSVFESSTGAPLANLHVEAVIGRPATINEDEAVVLRETIPGHYEASLNSRKAGAYIVEVMAQNSSDTSQTYRARRRLWVKP